MMIEFQGKQFKNKDTLYKHVVSTLCEQFKETKFTCFAHAKELIEPTSLRYAIELHRVGSWTTAKTNIVDQINYKLCRDVYYALIVLQRL